MHPPRVYSLALAFSALLTIDSFGVALQAKATANSQVNSQVNSLVTSLADSSANTRESSRASSPPHHFGPPSAEEYERTRFPSWELRHDRKRVAFDWREIHKVIRRYYSEEPTVVLIADGMDTHTFPAGQLDGDWEVTPLGIQHDYVLKFVLPSGEVIHETDPVLVDGWRTKTVRAESFKQKSHDEPLELSLPKSFTEKTGINDGLVKRTVELGYKKIIWILTDAAKVTTRGLEVKYGSDLQVEAALAENGDVLGYKLYSPHGEFLAQAGAEEIRIQNDAAFSGHAFFWDNQFVSLASALHHPQLSRATLDFHYAAQEKSGVGVIPREVRHTNNLSYFRYEDIKLGRHRLNNQYTNPNFTGWVENYIYALEKPETGAKRIRPAIQSLLSYANWIETNRAVKDDKGNLIGFWTSNLGAGMDNSPRAGGSRNEENYSAVGWVDVLSEHVLLYRSAAQLAKNIGSWDEADRYEARAREYSKLLNTRYWNSQAGFYFDVMPGPRGYGADTPTPTQAGFWALVAKAADTDRTVNVIAQQMIASAFGGRFPGASLPSTHPEYHPEGFYWQGGRWPPTEVIMSQGFENSNRLDQSFKIARDFWARMSEVSAEYRAKTGQDSVFEFYGVRKVGQRWKAIIGEWGDHDTGKDFTGWGKTPITYSGIRHVAGLRPVPGFAGPKKDLTRWMTQAVENGDSFMSFALGLNPAAELSSLAAGGYLEWNLLFDFQIGESIQLKNLVYQGAKVETLKVTKLRADQFQISAKVKQPVTVQLNRLFDEKGLVTAKPLRSSRLITLTPEHEKERVDFALSLDKVSSQ